MESLYFTHDYNASEDPKLRRACRQMGAGAIGMFWKLIEYLYQNNNEGSMDDTDWLAHDIYADEQQMRSIITDYGLFEVDEDGLRFTSPSVDKRMNKRKEATERRSRAGQQGASTRWKPTTDGKETAPEPAPRREDDTPPTTQEAETQQAVQEAQPQPETQAQERRPTRSKKFSLDTATPPEWLAPHLTVPFARWLDYKRARGNGYANEESARVCYCKLAQLSHGDPAMAQKIVDNSIANNWQGLFQLDDGKAIPKNNMVLHNEQTVYSQF